MGYPAEVLLAALTLAIMACVGAVLYVRSFGITKRNLARLDFVAFLAGAGGLLSLVPESVRMLAPHLMSDDPTVWKLVGAFKYLAFLLVSVSIGLGAARRWYTVHIER